MNMICIYHGNCADGFTAAWGAERQRALEDFNKLTLDDKLFERFGGK